MISLEQQLINQFVRAMFPHIDCIEEGKLGPFFIAKPQAMVGGIQLTSAV